GEAAVGVAVEGDAGVGAVLDHGGAETVDVGRSAAVVDVEPVGGGVDGDDLGASAAEGFGGGVGGRAVGGVDDDLESGEGVRAHRDEVLDICLDGRGGLGDAADRLALRQRLDLAHGTLD